MTPRAFSLFTCCNSNFSIFSSNEGSRSSVPNLCKYFCEIMKICCQFCPRKTTSTPLTISSNSPNHILENGHHQLFFPTTTLMTAISITTTANRSTVLGKPPVEPIIDRVINDLLVRVPRKHHTSSALSSFEENVLCAIVKQLLPIMRSSHTTSAHYMQYSFNFYAVHAILKKICEFKTQ